jgi:hypothetical protein
MSSKKLKKKYIGKQLPLPTASIILYSQYIFASKSKVEEGRFQLKSNERSLGT